MKAKVSRDIYLLNPEVYAKRGNDLPHAKLNPEKAREIKINRNGETAKQLAARFGVHHRTIDKIRDGKTWKFV